MFGKRQYYYLVAGLQDIALDSHKLIFRQRAFRDELKASLHPDDYRLVKKLFLPSDNINLLNLLQKNDKAFLEEGIYTKEELLENIREPHSLPRYMQQFIEAFKAKEPIYQGMSRENELSSLFLEEMLQLRNAFLRDWFCFDMRLRNITTALVARKHKLPYENQIIGQDEFSETIRRSHARDFGLSSEFDAMEELMGIVRNDDVQQREKEIDQLRWQYLDEAVFFHYFTIERVLAYTIKLGLVERWMALEKDHGRELFKKLLDELQASYQLPKSFTEK